MNTESVSISQALAWATGELTQAGVENPRLDAEVLLAHCLGANRAALYRDAADVLAQRVLEEFRTVIGRRWQREPVAYITGIKEFHSREFRITRDVLIPRPETETLVEEVIRGVAQVGMSSDAIRILEVGTGSGIIAVTLAKEVDRGRIIALDCTYAIVCLARSNAQLHGVDHKICFLVGDLCEALKIRGATHLFDVMVCNPPYLSDSEWCQSPPEIRKYEPERSLRAETDGLACYRALLPAAGALLKSGGCLMLEIGCEQATSVVGLAGQTGLFSAITTAADLSGVQRVVKARRR